MMKIFSFWERLSHLVKKPDVKIAEEDEFLEETFKLLEAKQSAILKQQQNEKEEYSTIGNYSFEDVGKAMRLLDHSLKIPLILHLSGYKYKELASKLDMDFETYKLTVESAKKKLYDILEGLGKKDMDQ